jgi:hypothetical protein
VNAERPDRSLLDAALGYAQRGWLVLPLQERGKAPDGRLVPHGLKDASRDPARIRSWWRASPGANVGLRTGTTLDVVDLDGPRSLLEDHGTFRPGAVVATGRGWHYYFAASGLPNRTALVPGVDVRGVGGYVVAPPSLHPSGTRYCFVDPGTGVPSQLPPRGALSMPPRWLAELCRRTGPERANTDDPIPLRLDASAYARAALAGECAAVAATAEGSRNDRLNRAAFAAGTLVAAGALDPLQVTELLTNAARRAGLPESEARRTIASGLKAGQERPRQLAPGPAVPPRARDGEGRRGDAGRPPEAARVRRPLRR